MPIVSKQLITRRRVINPFAGVLLFALLLFSSFVIAAQNSHVKLLYFFSTTCNHCNDAKPAVIALSKDFAMEGLQFGEGTYELPFAIKAGDKKIAKEVYHIAGVPTLVVLLDETIRLKIEGAPDIADARVLALALSRGALTVTEAAAAASQGEVTIAGWIISKGDYFKDPQFFITDRQTEIPIRAWLPLEAVKPPFKSTNRPRLMSDVIKKPAFLSGRLIKKDKMLQFLVNKEVNLETK